MIFNRIVKSLLVKLFLLYFCAAQAQSNQLAKDTSSYNKIVVSFSYNFYPYTQKILEPELFDIAKTFQPDSGAYISNHKTRIPASLSVVKSVGKRMHFGGVVNYQEYNGAVLNRNNRHVYGYKGIMFQIMFRYNWQFLTTRYAEAYVAASCGFRNNKCVLIKGNGYSNPISSNFIAAEALFGFRFKITNYLGVFTEIGVANTPLKLGICFINRPTNPFKNDSPYY